ncbi:MAG: hypothetical protein ABI629_16900 [bacterium]
MLFGTGEVCRAAALAPPFLSTGAARRVEHHVRRFGTTTLAFGSTSGRRRSDPGVFKADDKEVQTIMFPRAIPLPLHMDETFDACANTLAGVDDQDYQPPRIHRHDGKPSLAIDHPTLTPEDTQLECMMHANPGPKPAERP